MAEQNKIQPDEAADLATSGFRIESTIGAGGFGRVYLAEQLSVGRDIALKVLPPFDDDLSRVRFDRECRALGRLSWHPNIVVIHDAGVTAGGRPYLAMEYVSGGTLGQELRAAKGLPPQRVLRVGVQVAGAISAAHAAGVLHRDIKPGNVLLTGTGDAKLADFGIARLSGAEVTRSTGDFTATIAYTPPELLENDDPSESSDVYSLAATLFAALTGTPAFVTRQASPITIAMRIAKDPLPDLRPSGVPGALCDAIETAMAKDPKRRTQNAADLAEALQRVELALGYEATPFVRERGKVSIPTQGPSAEDTIPRAKESVPKIATPKKPAPKRSAPNKPAAQALKPTRPAAAKKAAPRPAVVEAPPAPAPTVAAPTPAQKSRPLPIVGAIGLVVLAVAVGIGGGLSLRRFRSDDSPTTTTTAMVPSTTVPVPAYDVTLPNGYTTTVFVAVKVDSPLSVRSGPAVSESEIGQLPSGTGGVRVIGDEQNGYVPIQAVMQKLNAPGAFAAQGWVSARYLVAASVGPTRAKAAAAMRRAGFTDAGGIWTDAGLSALVGTSSLGNHVFFFFNGVALGTEGFDPVGRIEVVAVSRGVARLRVNGMLHDYVADSLPLRLVSSAG